MDNLIEAFKRNKISVSYFENRSLLLSHLMDSFPSDSMIGVGDSITLEELNLYQYFRDNFTNFLDKYNKNMSKAEKEALYLKNFEADYFISGVNAITETGAIVNLDGNGSRVAPIIYGPRQVWLISGTNKIVKDETEAIRRIRTIAAPMDAQRLGKNTPCSSTGICVDCKSPEKICNYWSVIRGQFNPERIKLLIVNEALGY